jgi:hypothetical protein
MITLKRSEERGHHRRRGQDLWRTFGGEGPTDSAGKGFRALDSFAEEGLAPGTGSLVRFPRDLEVLVYVREGALLSEDGSGVESLVEAGECRRSSAAGGSTRRAFNRSPEGNTHAFYCGILPDRDHIQFHPEQRRFPLAERRGILRLMGSPDGRDGSLRLHQDVRIYSSILDPGHHLIYELARSRAAWLHVVKGRIQMVQHELRGGDAACLVEESAVSWTALEPSEILLFDLA